MRSVASLCVLAVVAHLVAPAQDTPPAKGAGSENAAKASEFAAAEAKRYDIRHADDKKRALKLVPDPVLRWSNPVTGDVHGAVYLWTRDGCPEAAASAYQFFAPMHHLYVELVSLAEAPLTAERNGKVRWTPEAGVKFAPLPDAPAAADTADKRQIQTRALARKFAGSMTDPDDPTKTRSVALRLMAKPLYQYEATDGSGREGAVFALVTTTDPEILLLVESRKTATGREWVWAAARMHYTRLQLKLGDTVAWEVPAAAPPWENLRGPKGTYIILGWKTPEIAAKD